jgi:hypothetical protein
MTMMVLCSPTANMTMNIRGQMLNDVYDDDDDDDNKDDDDIDSICI